MRDDARRSASDILLEAVHGGLRLQPGYMTRQYRAMRELVAGGQTEAYESYARALADSFGRAHVAHLEAWLRADGFVAAAGARPAAGAALASQRRRNAE